MSYDYGLWPMVALNVAVVLGFVLSFLRPARRREWRSFGVLVAFIVALYTEMYGFPLTIYLLAAALGRTPFSDPFAHTSGNLTSSLLGLGGQWAALFMLFGGVMIVLGVLIVAAGWRTIHAADGALVMNGPYAVVRHPQYSGLMLSVLGALVQWPTLITLVMAPVLIVTYYRLAGREERELQRRFAPAYAAYRARTPMFVPGRPPITAGAAAQGDASGMF